LAGDTISPRVAAAPGGAGRERDEQTEHRREAIRRTSGGLTGVYEPGHLERLRDDWPA
jgi:hypothetical protein